MGKLVQLLHIWETQTNAVIDARALSSLDV